MIGDDAACVSADARERGRRPAPSEWAAGSKLDGWRAKPAVVLLAPASARLRRRCRICDASAPTAAGLPRDERRRMLRKLGRGYGGFMLLSVLLVVVIVV